MKIKLNINMDIPKVYFSYNSISEFRLNKEKNCADFRVNVRKYEWRTLKMKIAGLMARL